MYRHGKEPLIPWQSEAQLNQASFYAGVTDDTIKLEYCLTGEMITDILAKGLGCKSCCYHARRLEWRAMSEKECSTLIHYCITC